MNGDLAHDDRGGLLDTKQDHGELFDHQRLPRYALLAVAHTYKETITN